MTTNFYGGWGSDDVWGRRSKNIIFGGTSFMNSLNETSKNSSKFLEINNSIPRTNFQPICKRSNPKTKTIASIDHCPEKNNIENAKKNMRQKNNWILLALHDHKLNAKRANKIVPMRSTLSNIRTIRHIPTKQF